MDTNVQALKNLYEKLGGDPADVSDISTNAGMIDAIAGLDIGGGTVDQTYDPESENAQSGVAVAQAMAAGKMTKIFSETFSYQWLADGTDIGKNFTQKITAKDNTLYLALIYASEGTNGIMGSIFMTKGLLGSSSILSGSTAIQYFDNPNIITGLANVMIYSGTNTALYLYMPAISTTQSQTTGKLEIYEIAL